MMVNLAGGFLKQGFEVDLVLAKAQGPYLKLVPEEVNVVDLGVTGVVRSLPELVRYLRRHRPDALLVTLNHASVVAVWARALACTKTRVVIRQPDMLFPTPSLSLTTKVLRVSVKLFYPWADGFIAVSEGVAHDLRRFARLPEKAIETVYNPVVTADMLAQAGETLEHPWFAPGEPPVILGAGRLVGQKDFATLLRAFAELRRTRSARLIILGEGHKRPELEALVGELGLGDDVSLPGFVDNPFAYMAQADTFVLSSRHEGLPGVLIQAMACGCKVLSTDCPSGPREILQDGRLGRLVPVGDVGALAQAMVATLDAEDAQMQRVRERTADFSEAKVVPQYLRALLAEDYVAPQPGSDTSYSGDASLYRRTRRMSPPVAPISFKPVKVPTSSPPSRPPE